MRNKLNWNNQINKKRLKSFLLFIHFVCATDFRLSLLLYWKVHTCPNDNLKILTNHFINLMRTKQYRDNLPSNYHNFLRHRCLFKIYLNHLSLYIHACRIFFIRIDIYIHIRIWIFVMFAFSWDVISFLLFELRRAYLDRKAMVIRLIILEILYLASNPLL